MDDYQTSKKEHRVRNLTVYIVLRFLIVLTGIFAFLDGNFSNVFSCIVSLLLFTIPTIVDKKFNVELPNMLEASVYIFIFSSQILGEIRNFYTIFHHWDTLLHTFNGFMFAGIGFSLVDILNTSNKTKIYLSPFYISIVAFCFSVTIGTAWEFFEYGMDRFTYLDMQKDTLLDEIYSVYIHDEGKNIVVPVKDITETTIHYGNGDTLTLNGYLDIGLRDTMFDMIVNAVGAVVFSFFGYFYVKSNEQFEFAKNFIPKIKK